MHPGNNSMRGNRIVIDGRTYDAKVLGGGRFNVFNAKGEHVGAFAVRGRAVEAEDLGVEGADPVASIGQLWVTANLSTQGPSQAAEAPRPPLTTPMPIVKPAPPAEAPKPVEVAAPVAAEPTPAAAPIAGAVKPGATCRIATHDRPDAASLKKAIAYEAWLRTQPGVVAAYLTHDTASGKTMSVTVWETRDQFTAMRYAKPPLDTCLLYTSDAADE